MARILVVDDEKDVKFLVQQRFNRHIQEGQFEFSFAHNGREALHLLTHERPFEVMITDIEMPDVDGLFLLNHVQEYVPTTKTIVVSAYDDWHYIRQAMHHGAFDFITKPLDFKELERSLEKCLKRMSHQRKSL